MAPVYVSARTWEQKKNAKVARILPSEIMIVTLTEPVAEWLLLKWLWYLTFAVELGDVQSASLLFFD